MAGFCAGTSVPNCTATYTSIQPDPDIDGIGVVISFLVSAGLTLITSLFGLVLEQLPTELPEDRKGSSKKSSREPWGIIRKNLSINKETREYIETIIERFVLGLADVQLLTGTSMLLVAFLKCDITTYHFGLIIDLVWFSSNTHLTATLVLSDYLREYHAARFWRVILMGTMCLFLMVATILETNKLWYSQLPLPVRCMFLNTAGNMQGSSNTGWTITTIVLLVYGYSVTIAKLFSRINDRIEKWFSKTDIWMEARLKKLILDSRTHSSLCASLVRIACKCVCIVKFIIKFFQYMNFVFDLVWFALGIWFLFADIATGQQYMDTSSSSTQSWGFGQLIPMFLLSLPILTVLEIFWGKFD